MGFLFPVFVFLKSLIARILLILRTDKIENLVNSVSSLFVQQITLKLTGLKQRTFVNSWYLWVRRMGLAKLRGSGLESLMRLQSCCQLGSLHVKA